MGSDDDFDQNSPENENQSSKSLPKTNSNSKKIKKPPKNPNIDNFSVHSFTISQTPLETLEVHFPYAKPYPAQNTMMWRLIMAIQNSKNALVESPTGSGKTISYLCSAIAWLKHHNINKK